MNSESVAGLLLEAGSLMLTGMIFVFAFLGLLIIGIHLIARFCEAFPGEVTESKGPNMRPNAVAKSGIDGKVVAAISAAIHSHRQANRK